MTTTQQFWIGTLTGDSAGACGIYSAQQRPDGTLALLGCAAEADSPSYLALHPRRQVLYATREQRDGGITAYEITDVRSLRQISTREVPAGPCYVAVHPDGKYLLVASYLAGTVAAVRLNPDGSFAGSPSIVTGAGTGPRADRQEGPHAHCAITAPDGTVLSTDLGADLVRAHQIDPVTGTLKPLADLALPPGCGPRHLVVHPSGRVYVITELAHTVLVLTPGHSYAELTVTAETPATVGGADAASLSGAIKLSADGHRLYTSTRGVDVITTHEVRDDGARLHPLADIPCGGHWPRDFHVNGDWLHVANERSGSIQTFHLDAASGVPVPVGAPVEVPGPTCIIG